MSKRRKIRVRGEPRNPPDYRKLSRALIALVQAQQEAAAQAEHAARRASSKPPRRRGPKRPGGRV